MNLKTKIYIAAVVAAIVIAIIGGGAIWSDHKVAVATQAVDEATKTADEKQKLADQKETESAEYKQTNEYLESKIADIEAIARKQDDELEKLKTNTAGARSDAERTHHIRSIASTTDELCQKLAEVGHGCH